MQARFLPAFALLGLAVAGPAQSTTVVPKQFENAEGDWLDGRPFFSDRVRCTQLLASSMVGVPSGRTITEIAYRRDKTVYPTQTLARGTATPAWSMRLGNLNPAVANWLFNPLSPTGTYMSPGDGNNNTLVEVYNTLTTFPSLPPVTTTTAPFAIRFKLARPFVYLGQGLAIDHYAYESTNRGYEYYVDASRSSVDLGTATPFGVSCPVDGNRAYCNPSNPGGDPLSVLLFDGPPSSVAVLILGSSRTTWGPFPLPLKLDFLGLSTCWLNVSVDVLLPVATFTNGSAQANISIPAAQALAGLRFFAQWMPVDTRVNPVARLAFSNGLDITTGSTVGQFGLASSLVYGVNNQAVIQGRVGLVDRGIALVTEIVYQ
jgi:hypothetical protein